MTDLETRPSRGILLFVIGGILLVVGAIGIIVFTTALTDHPSVDGSGTDALRGATIVGSAIATGVGVLLVVIGVVKRIAANSREQDPGSGVP